MQQDNNNALNRTSKDNRTGEYSESNDKPTFMNTEENLMAKLERDGYTEQFKVEKDKIVSVTTRKKYKATDVKAANFYRFEGSSDPEDTSILYAIETTDGSKGTLSDAYGMYSDDDTGAFMKKVETEKKLKTM